MRPLTQLFLFSTLLACHQPVQTAADAARTPKRDLLVHKYLHELDSLGYDDTASTSVRVLKAYLSNDTSLLKKLDSDRVEFLSAEQAESIYDSCIHQPRLQDMRIDEGYRFIFSEAFCHDKLNITITKVNDNLNLHCILYNSAYRPDGSGGGSHIKKEYDRRLTRAQWDSLGILLNRADFLALSTNNDTHGLDGDEITVIGYNNRPWSTPRLHIVNRWLVFHTPLGPPFQYVVNLSGGPQGCIYLDR